MVPFVLKIFPTTKTKHNRKIYKELILNYSMGKKVEKNEIYDFGKFLEWSKDTLLKQMEDDSDIDSDYWKPHDYRITSIEHQYMEQCNPKYKEIEKLRDIKIKHMTLGELEEKMDELKTLIEQLEDEDYDKYRDVMKKLGEELRVSLISKSK